MRVIQSGQQVPVNLDILAKELLQVLRRLVSETQRRENFEEEDTANSESNSAMGDDLSWNEREEVDDNDLYYDSVFDNVDYVLRFREFLKELE